MKRYILLFTILVSTVIHIILLSNINFSFHTSKENKLMVVEFVPLPVKKVDLSKETSDEQRISLQQETKKLIQKHKLNNKKEAGILDRPTISDLTENLCLLCGPVGEIEIKAEPDSYGEKIKSLLLQYKVSYDLGPNKGTLRDVNPFGSNQKKEYQQDFNEVGSLVITYEVADGQYSIEYNASATGIASVIYSKPLIQKSTGNINEDGLSPSYYLYQYGKERINEAFFNWKEKKLHIKKSGTDQTYFLLPGSQDQLSFMFQFMFLNPLDKMQIPITNAKWLKIYNYHYVDEEILYTQAGEVKALHIAKFDYEDPERIDLWLSEKYGYLPIKISITQDDLSTIVQEIITLKAIKNE